MDLTGRDVLQLQAEEMVVRAPRAAGARLPQASALDVRVESGDLANAVLRGASLVRVRVDGGRLTGDRRAGGPAAGRGGVGLPRDLASVAQARLRRVRFEDCDLRGLDLRLAELDGVRFERCDLSGAEFSGARCRRVEVVACDLREIGGLDSLRGSTWDWPTIVGQAGALAGALGIGVLDEDEAG